MITAADAWAIFEFGSQMIALENPNKTIKWLALTKEEKAIWNDIAKELQKRAERKLKCQNCEEDAVYLIIDTKETRHDIQESHSCERCLGKLIGSVPPTKPEGPWHIYLIENN